MPQQAAGGVSVWLAARQKTRESEKWQHGLTMPGEAWLALQRKQRLAGGAQKAGENAGIDAALNRNSSINEKRHQNKSAANNENNGYQLACGSNGRK